MRASVLVVILLLCVACKSSEEECNEARVAAHYEVDVGIDYGEFLPDSLGAGLGHETAYGITPQLRRIENPGAGRFQIYTGGDLIEQCRFVR